MELVQEGVVHGIYVSSLSFPNVTSYYCDYNFIISFFRTNESTRCMPCE